MAATNHLRVDKATFNANLMALDTMPPDLRREICFANIVYDAVDVSKVYRERVENMGKKPTIRWLCASIQGGDDWDLQKFGQQFRARYHIPLPHIAAGATILRYQPPVEARNAHRRVVVPLRVRSAWRSTERLMPQEGLDEGRAPLPPIDEALAGRFANLDLPAA